MASINKIMCFIRIEVVALAQILFSTYWTEHVLVETLNFCLVQIWVKFAKAVVFYSTITKHGNFNTEIDSSASVNYETP